MCDKLQANYKLFKHEHKIPKECTQNIDMTISENCMRKSVIIYYTDQMMIDDWFKSSDMSIDDQLLHCWFKDNIRTIFKNIDCAKDTLAQLIDMSNTIQKKIDTYKNKLSTVIIMKNINTKILKAPQRRLKMYIDIVKHWINIQTKQIYNLTNHDKYCVCCGLKYDSAMMNNKYYCGDIQPWTMTQMNLNNNICCCFCITRVHNMAKYAKSFPNANWNELSFCDEIAHWLTNYNSNDNTWFLCWYDFMYEKWRYATIVKVLNSQILKLKILISDIDLFAAQQLQTIILSECLPYSYFIYFQATSLKFEIFDHQFSIKADDDHKLDWLHSKNVFQDQWQITITMRDGTTLPVQFWQIRNSKQLYMYLLENRKM